MKYAKGMKRYGKAGGKYNEDDKGAYYKAGDGKMYKMMAPTGVDTKEDKPGQADDHAHSHSDDNTDYPGTGDRGGSKEVGKKSMISEDDLNKTLDELETLIKSDDPVSRKEALLVKAQTGDLSNEERDELFKALGGGDELADEDPTFAEGLTKSFGDNEALQKSLDVSEYLDEQHGELVKALTAVADRIESSDLRQHDFNIVLAKAIHQEGTLIKAMSHRLGVIEEQPARGPKSQGVRVPEHQGALAKSFGGDPAAGTGEAMSKGEALDCMVDMMEKSSNGQAPCGEDITEATAKYEQTGLMSKAMLGDIVKFRQANAH